MTNKEYTMPHNTGSIVVEFAMFVLVGEKPIKGMPLCI